MFKHFLLNITFHKLPKLCNRYLNANELTLRYAHEKRLDLALNCDEGGAIVGFKLPEP
jgi:hypothetical protein